MICENVRMKKVKNMTMKYTYKKSVRVLAAAALTAVLMGSQVMPVFATDESMVETNTVIPENITIEYPVPLSEVVLPESEKGTLKWTDDSFVPSKRVQSCEVEFKPVHPEEFQDCEGWDAEAGVLFDSVTVVVSSIQEETPEEEPVQPQVPEITVTPGVTETPESSPAPEVSVTPSEKPEEMPKEPEAEGEVPSDSEGELGNDELIQEEVPEAESDSKDNIFDQPEENFTQDNRPTDVEETISEEEKLLRADENHNCNGIGVSGINLPWYVQFRVSSGSAYQFTNEADAGIFQSYEFELWDLQNNTEYDIPDGEYVSVTVPVKEGYDYTIEHLLDNGAMETIIPSVEGGTMVFSTSSFSPFGIAGSKPLVGEELTDDNYGSSAEIDGEDGAEGENVTTITNTPTASSGNEDKESGSSQVIKEDKNTSSDANTAKDTKDTGNSSSKTVNTGDNTPILPFVILFVAAIAVIAGVVVFLKKRK